MVDALAGLLVSTLCDANTSLPVANPAIRPMGRIKRAEAAILAGLQGGTPLIGMTNLPIM